MPYVRPTANWPILGTLTADDREDIMATLAAAEIDTSTIAVSVSPSGTAFFTRQVSHGMANDIKDLELLDRMGDALATAGWEVKGANGRRSPGIDLTVLRRPAPAVGDPVAVPSYITPGRDEYTGEVTAVADDTVTVALNDGCEHEIAIDAIVPSIWDIDQVAAFLAIQPASARGQLSRWEVRARSYYRDADGRMHARYLSTEVRTAAANRPGRGARTDLR